jgi:hypothetical protein
MQFLTICHLENVAQILFTFKEKDNEKITGNHQVYHGR